MPGDRYFIDTAAFVYRVEGSNPARLARAADIVDGALHTGRGVTSFQMVREFLDIVTRHAPGEAALCAALRYAEDVIWPLVVVHPTPHLYFRAMGIHERWGYSLCDAKVIAAALEARCDLIYTDDMQHGQEVEGLVIHNPFGGQAA